jgi:hypothetical protein
MTNSVRVNEPGFISVRTATVGTNAYCESFTFVWQGGGGAMAVQVRDNEFATLYTEQWSLDQATLQPYMDATATAGTHQNSLEEMVCAIMTDVFAGTIQVPGHN